MCVLIIPIPSFFKFHDSKIKKYACIYFLIRKNAFQIWWTTHVFIYYYRVWILNFIIKVWPSLFSLIATYLDFANERIKLFLKIYNEKYAFYLSYLLLFTRWCRIYSVTSFFHNFNIILDLVPFKNHDYISYSNIWTEV